ILNIVGLSVAFGIAILLCTAALFDLSFDKFHHNIGSTYKLYSTIQTPKGPEAAETQPVPLAAALRTEVPGIKKITRFGSGRHNLAYESKELNISFIRVDPDFFDMFSFPVMRGNSAGLLKEKSDLILTEESAKRIFNSTDVIGKTVLVNTSGKDEPFTVTAVLKDIPQQSSIRFGAAIRFENYGNYEENLSRWDNKDHEVFLQLQDNVTAAQFEQRSRPFSNLHFATDIAAAKRDGAKTDANGQLQQMRLLPFEQEHFVRYQNGVATVEKTRVYLIIGIALLILFIACVNFVNMSIGTSVQRLREIGMRKALGAGKTQLFFQFWGESVIVFLFAVGIGILLSNGLLESFKTLFRIQASFSNVITPQILLGFTFSVILITLMAGGYPALLLSKLGTLQSLKGKLEVSGKNRLRNTLIVIQFTIAILLISGTLVLQSQLDYMQTKDLGFNKEQVIAFPLNGKKKDREALQLLRNELQGKADIYSVSASDNILGRGKDGSSFGSVLGFEHKGRSVRTNMLVVDYDYPETMELKLLAGRSFNRSYGNDSLAVMINEAMARELEEGDPLNASILFDDSVKHTIIGVMKDYHFQGLDKKIEPITFFLKEDWQLHNAYVRVSPQNLSQSMETIKAAWKKVEPNAEFLGSYLDENIGRALRQEKVMTTIITSGAVIAIVLSCLGLFAIALLVVAQRTKEIGIRKVVGAGITNLTFLLSKDFLKLVVVALVIAIPIAWLLTSKWLEGYAYRITLNPWYFIAAGLLALLIAFATISLRTIKAAKANPVKSLRTE
ncbi:MAG TPA: ABC transporter permease, partial [Flavisolibacter sp.]